MASICPISLPAIVASGSPAPKGRSSFKLHVSSSSPSLSKPEVVVTRERGKNAKLMSALAKHDIQCLEVPLIEHTEGPDAGKLPSLLCESEFDWIVTTSPEAAAVFLEAWNVVGLDYSLMKVATRSGLLELPKCALVLLELVQQVFSRTCCSHLSSLLRLLSAPQKQLEKC